VGQNDLNSALFICFLLQLGCVTACSVCVNLTLCALYRPVSLGMAAVCQNAIFARNQRSRSAFT